MSFLFLCLVRHALALVSADALLDHLAGEKSELTRKLSQALGIANRLRGSLVNRINDVNDLKRELSLTIDKAMNNYLEQLYADKLIEDVSKARMLLKELESEQWPMDGTYDHLPELDESLAMHEEEVSLAQAQAGVKADSAASACDDNSNTELTEEAMMTRDENEIAEEAIGMGLATGHRAGSRCQTSVSPADQDQDETNEKTLEQVDKDAFEDSIRMD